MSQIAPMLATELGSYAVRSLVVDRSVRGSRPASAASSSSVLSHIPGRARFRVPAVKGQRSRAAWLAERLMGLRGVRAASVNALTGGVLVLFDERQTNLFELRRALESPL